MLTEIDTVCYEISGFTHLALPLLAHPSERRAEKK